MRRLSLWMRAHPMVGDSATAALLALLDVLVWMTAPRGQTNEPGLTPDTVPFAVLVVTTAATVLPLVIRRKNPVLFAYLVLLFGSLQIAVSYGLAPLLVSAIGVYTLVVYVSRRHALLYIVITAVASVIQLIVQFGTSTQLTSSLSYTALVMGFSWILGEFVGARRAYQAELEARLHLLETERDQATRIAVADERGRIARELHDVVAHSVSVIVVQADGASYALDSDPETTRSALRTISQTGRSALSELRRLLGVLRNDGADEDQPRQPQPDLTTLSELAQRMTATGLPVTLELDGDLPDLPTGVTLGVNRIVQESLTNSLKHAGQGARAQVKVARTTGGVEVEVLDDGAGRAQPIVDDPSTQQRPAVGGNGLIGMRERAIVFGGTLTVGPRPAGGWRVHAVIPHTGAGGTVDGPTDDTMGAT